MAADAPTSISWDRVTPISKSPKPRWGHSFCALDNRRAVLFGGISGGAMFNDTYLYDTESVEWISPAIRGSPPSPRWGHSTNVVLPGGVMVLGGREGSKPLPLDRCYVGVIIGSEVSWHERSILSTVPPKHRYIHATLMLEGERRLLLFGGHGGRSRYYNDVHLLDLSDAALSLPALPSDGSMDRLPSSVSLLRPAELTPLAPVAEGASACSPHTAPPGTASVRTGSAKGSGIVGHRESSAVSSELHAGSPTDPDSPSTSPPIGRWHSPVVSGSLPPKRSGHTLTRCGSRALLFGGFNGKEILSDVYTLDLSSFVWTYVSVTGLAELPPSHGHCAAAIPGTSSVLIFGGSVSATQLSNATHMIDCKLHTVSRLPLDNPPEPRFWHRSCVADGCLYVFGGSGITGNGTSDIVKLDLRHLTNPDMFGDEWFAMDDAGTATSSVVHAAASMAIGLGGVGRLGEEEAAGSHFSKAKSRSVVSGGASAVSAESGKSRLEKFGAIALMPDEGVPHTHSTPSGRSADDGSVTTRGSGRSKEGKGRRQRQRDGGGSSHASSNSGWSSGMYPQAHYTPGYGYPQDPRAYARGPPGYAPEQWSRPAGPLDYAGRRSAASSSLASSADPAQHGRGGHLARPAPMYKPGLDATAPLFVPGGSGVYSPGVMGGGGGGGGEGFGGTGPLAPHRHHVAHHDRGMHSGGGGGRGYGHAHHYSEPAPMPGPAPMAPPPPPVHTAAPGLPMPTAFAPGAAGMALPGFPSIPTLPAPTGGTPSAEEFTQLKNMYAMLQQQQMQMMAMQQALLTGMMAGAAPGFAGAAPPGMGAPIPPSAPAPPPAAPQPPPPQ